MRGTLRAGIVFALVGLAMPGCATTSDARYVYQDNEFGVVAIPRNTPQGSNHYREQAEALMAQHFPQGYQIVRAEEVVEGSRTVTVGRTGITELAPQVSPHLLALLKVGGTISRSQAETTNLTECRIIYKKADTSGGFARESSLTPVCYLDPSLEPRKHDKEPPKASHVEKEHEAPKPGARPEGE